MSTLTDDIAAAMVANLANRHAWDEPADLFWVTHRGGKVSLDPFPMAQDWLNTERPPMALAQFARDAAREPQLFRRIVPPSLIGLVFFCESWTTFYRNPAEFRQAGQHLRNHPPETNPDSVEQRILMGVERGGARFCVSQTRGQSIETEISIPGVSATRHAGLGSRALDQLLSAALGVTITPTTKI